MKEPMPMAEERNARSEAHEVAQWLRRHPRFLEHFPDLAVTLVVPKDGGASASLASPGAAPPPTWEPSLARRPVSGDAAMRSAKRSVKSSSLTFSNSREIASSALRRSGVFSIPTSR